MVQRIESDEMPDVASEEGFRSSRDRSMPRVGSASAAKVFEESEKFVRRSRRQETIENFSAGLLLFASKALVIYITFVYALRAYDARPSQVQGQQAYEYLSAAIKAGVLPKMDDLAVRMNQQPQPALQPPATLAAPPVAAPPK